MSLDFEKYVAKGVIGDISAVALYTSGANWKMKRRIFYQVTLSQKPFKAPASCAWVHFADTWCKVKKTTRKELIQRAARSNDPAVGGQQAASSGWAAGRNQAAGHMFATSQDRAASRNSKFVCVR